MSARKSRKSRERRHRRDSKAFLRSGGTLKPKHQSKSGRTGKVHVTKLKSRKPE